jgi:hypothetical protein
MVQSAPEKWSFLPARIDAVPGRHGLLEGAAETNASGGGQGLPLEPEAPCNRSICENCHSTRVSKGLQTDGQNSEKVIMSAKISEQIATAPDQSSSPANDIVNRRDKDDSQEQESREELARKLEAQATSLGVIVQSFAIAGAFHI